MAAVDLGGGDAQRLRGAYNQSLRRDASDDELTGWLSGGYGGGGVDDWIRQIQGSHEAQQYQQPPQTPTLGPSPGENYTMPTSDPTPSGGGDPFAQIEQWYQQFLGRGTGQDDAQSWLSGAYGWGDASNMQGIYNGIAGSAEARNRPGAQPPTATGAPTAPSHNLDWWSAQGVPQSEMFDLTTGQIKPGWQRTAQGYERTGGTGAVSAPAGGNFQQWFSTLTNGKRVSPKTLKELEPTLNQYGIKLGPLNGRGFTDGIILPDGSFVDVILSATEDSGTGWGWITGGGGNSSLNMPGGQYSDQYTALLEMMLKQRMQSLNQPVNDPNRAMYEMMLKSRADALGGANTQVDQLMKYLQERFTDLKGPGYTGAENEVIRTQALDPMESDRNAAKKRVTERLSARGLSPDSGIYQQALLEVDKAFDAMRGETQGALASNELARREDRSQRAQTIGAQLVDIPNARAREQLDVFSVLEQLSQTMRSEEDARAREGLGYAGVLSDLGPQRLQLALQAMGAGGSPESLGNSLFNMANLNQNAALLNRSNSGSLWSGLGSIAAILSQSGR